MNTGLTAQCLKLFRDKSVRCLKGAKMKHSLRTSFLAGAFLTICLSILLSPCAQSQSCPSFLYTNDNVSGGNGNTVTAFCVGADGTLTQIGMPTPTGGVGSNGGLIASNRVIVDPVGNFLFASNSGSNNVSAFSIDPATGILAPVQGSPFSTGVSTDNGLGISLAATPDGKFLMAGNAGSNNVTVFSINDDGSLSTITNSPFSTGGPSGSMPDGMKVNPIELLPPNYAFLTAGLTVPDVAVLTAAPNGSLAQVLGSPFPGTDADTGVDIKCSGNQLFAGNSTNGAPETIDVFSFALDGTLTPILGSPFQASGIDSQGVLLSPDAPFLFVSNQGTGHGDDTITVFQVGPNGFLTPVGPPVHVNSNATPALMATNQAGTFLFVANIPPMDGQGSIGAFSVGSDGSLTGVDGSPFPVSNSVLGGIAVFPTHTCVTPVPAIVPPLVPDVATPGGPEFTLTVNGTGFVLNSVVNWNGTELSTTVVNDDQVTATVPAANIAMAGVASVTVSSPAPGGGASNIVLFPITIPVCAPLVQGSSVLYTISVTANCTDPYGTIQSTTINWGDGSPPASGTSGMHTYAAAGTYLVTVSATDNLMQVGSASQSVTLSAPAPPVFAGQQTTLLLSVVSSNGTPTVTFSCSGATGPNGQFTSDPEHTFGITCAFSPATLTLKIVPQTVSLTIGTTGGGSARISRPSRFSGFAASLDFSMPLAGLVLFGWDLSNSRRRRSAFLRGLMASLLLALLLLTLSCGGGFTPPTQPQPPPGQPTTAPGMYYLTAVGTDSTGFVQTSLIAPLNVTSP
jgi:hypothetical protein